MGVISIMTRYRNRKHLVDLLGATEHAAAHLIGSTGKYRGHWDAMPPHLQQRFKNLIEAVFQTNAVYTGWLIESRPDLAPDTLKEFMK